MLKKLLCTNLAVILIGAVIISAPAAFGVADTTTLQQVINQGSLTTNIVNANVTLTAKTYSHIGQANNNNALGDIGIVDARGTNAGWVANWTGADWTGGPGMDYDGDGTTTGQLCIDNPVAANVTVNGGTDDKATWTYGSDTCFAAGTSTINMITTGAAKGDGDYTVAASEVDQWIPAQQDAATYNMTLTLTVS